MDGAPACPFVAFGDDRDGRSTSPDHRHRCFAESPPAPRALAHQEAYCLSSAFPVCPTFQDWARREAAHARGGGEKAETAPTATPTTPEGADGDGDGDDGEHPAGSPPVAPAPDPVPWPSDLPVRRNPPRDWAAPPPWASGGPGRAGSPVPAPDVASEFLAPTAEGQGLAGSAADRLTGGALGGSVAGGIAAGAAGGAAAADAASSGGGAGATGTGAAATPHAGSSSPGPTVWSASAGGSAATAPDDDLAGLVRARPAVVTVDEPAHDPYAPPARAGRRPAVSSTRPSGDAVPGPPWERMRRYEAYPTIKTRAGLPGLPRIAVLIGALAIAALILFMLPALLGVGGGNKPSASPSTSSRPAASGLASVAPTTPAGPSPQTYIIQNKDTLSKVAKKFGITLAELLAANPDIKDPNKIALGQVIVIPTPGPGSSVAPSGSAAAGSKAP